MTPRPGKDATGLSTFDTLEAATPEGGKTQVIDTTQLTSLEAIYDGYAPGHVSITPGTSQAVEEWAATRGTGNVHPWT